MSSLHREMGETIPGWMQRDELLWLASAAERMHSIIEIGCWFGRSTSALCSSCPGKVIAIDHFQGSPEHQELISMGANPYEEFLKHTRAFQNLRLFPMSSRDASNSPLIPPSVDFVFIDGEHSRLSVCEDLILWAGRARKLVAGHDFDMPGVYSAVKLFFRQERLERGPGSIWFVQRGVERCQSSRSAAEEALQPSSAEALLQLQQRQ